ncbi:formate/nitrite transporter family protein [Haliangium ochraceum]|uniref:Site-specific recombinase n=1 Tax=Haliangium ochraceum (strain DSM 14365 / JCM 11303 / SMP-2) TaxID=502025 RepID=D0LL80_HALO1|nr:formate/nitrite transporter family protein [Haliangium ochraceum]ACY18576.1 site-specific recombinase [Haliangium ochraceum DSM 14365]
MSSESPTDASNTAPSYPRLQALVDDLRAAAKAGPTAVNDVVRDSAVKMRDDAEYATAVREDVKLLLANTESTHLLTEAGILADEPLLGGILRRMGSNVAPVPNRSRDLEHELASLVRRRDERWIRLLRVETLRSWLQVLTRGTQNRWDDPRELASALVILATRIAGVGLNARLVERLPELERWSSPIIALARAVDQYASALVEGKADEDMAERALKAVDACTAQVESFRFAENAFGTTVDLSSRSLRMLQQLARLRQILAVLGDAQNAGSKAAATLSLELLLAVSQRMRTRRFMREKLDLLAYLAVGHAAQKGANYVVRKAADYWKFLGKSIFGGVLVGIFGSLKIHLSHEGLAPMPQAFIYGLNYAVCFALIYLFGATLATKQPAVTASRLARALESNERAENFAKLVRAIWHSQSISFVGNILGASAFAALIAWLFAQLTGQPLVSEAEANKLLKSLHPFKSLSLYYAAIAGVMLSFAGFFSGFVDNAVVFHRVATRISAGSGIFRVLPRRTRDHIARRVNAKLGALSGNVVLGFLLGSAGTIGYITGLPFDIRHVAFASSHATLGLLRLDEVQTPMWVLGMLGAVLLIAFVNFIVSFGLTLIVAIEARKVEGADWRFEVGNLLRLIIQSPLRFFFPFPERAEKPRQPAS